MNFRKFLLCTVVLLILFLSMYAWNRGTGALDRFAANVGLEGAGAVLNVFRQAQSAVISVWDDYVYLVDTREENKRLTERVREMEAELLKTSEDMAELRRLRELLKMPADVTWTPVGARVVAGRVGPNSRLETFTINRGYVNGASPGTPVVTSTGLLGRVRRSAPHTSTIFLLTNPMSRIAIFTQKTRSAGILVGMGPGKPLEVLYVSRDTKTEQGEILVTSGLDGKYPKGIPVARVLSLEPSNYADFMTIHAEPLADLLHVEEVLLLEPTGLSRQPEPAVPGTNLMGPFLPDFLKKNSPSQQKAPAAAPGGM